MLKEANEVIEKYESLTKSLSDPETIANQDLFKKKSIEYSHLSEAYAIAKQLRITQADVTEAEELIKNESDPELVEFYKNTITENTPLLNKLKKQLKAELRPEAKDEKRNAIVEIRAGAGGDEAALFAGDLYRMYLKFCESKGWKIQQISSNTTGTGGIKEVIFSVSGERAYGTLKYENGVHRVQRIPATESSGRIHTSAASVVVMPEVDDVEVEIRDEDVKVDTYRSSGPGGQSVNTTDSAIRLTHLPTGIVVTCQDEKSQHKNKARALSILKSRLYELEKEKHAAEMSKQRQSSIKSGDRSVKIRTYNYPQSRVTDHRIKQSWHNLSEIMDGDLDEVIKTTKQQLLEQE